MILNILMFLFSAGMGVNSAENIAVIQYVYHASRLLWT